MLAGPYGARDRGSAQPGGRADALCGGGGGGGGGGGDGGGGGGDGGGGSGARGGGVGPPALERKEPAGASIRLVVAADCGPVHMGGR
ncbi:hypothetical protein DCW30_05120 [Streptomyces alfalfae]|nr:hypothetical protein D3X13_22865 [Streptomyces fradiae]RXX46423.1 hypothetical protein DCW30_05120 [Streptomyces alfalfae]RZM99549.1 hypothetical protein D4104_09850 [Streptomyces alfalfae]